MAGSEIIPTPVIGSDAGTAADIQATIDKMQLAMQAYDHVAHQGWLNQPKDASPSTAMDQFGGLDITDTGKPGKTYPPHVDVGHIPPWQKNIEDHKAEEEQKRREAEERKAKEAADKAAALEEQKHKDALDKAVKDGAIPPDVLKEYQSPNPARGVRELVDKILEGYGADPRLSHLDGSVGSYNVSEFMRDGIIFKTAEGADAKLSRMTPEEAKRVLREWVNEGKNPLEPGGALEQELYGEKSRGGQREKVDLGVYNPRSEKGYGNDGGNGSGSGNGSDGNNLILEDPLLRQLIDQYKHQPHIWKEPTLNPYVDRPIEPTFKDPYINKSLDPAFLRTLNERPSSVPEPAFIDPKSDDQNDPYKILRDSRRKQIEVPD